MIFPNHLKRKRGSKHNTARYCQHILVPWCCLCSLRAIGCLYSYAVTANTVCLALGQVHPLIPRSPQFSHVIHKPENFMHRNEKKMTQRKRRNQIWTQITQKNFLNANQIAFTNWAIPAYITQMKTSKSQIFRGNQGTLHELRVSA